MFGIMLARLLRIGLVYTREPRFALWLARAGFPTALELHQVATQMPPKKLFVGSGIFPMVSSKVIWITEALVIL